MVVSDTHIIGIVGGVLLASASLAHANSIVLSENAYSYGVAGEFSMAASDDFVANYAASATLNGQFETFCVQANVNVFAGETYSYTLSNQDSMGRALSEGAAFLYYEFATGQLQGYDYGGPAVREIRTGQSQPDTIRRTLGLSSTVERQDDAGELQAAIWAFQGNQSLPGFPSLATDPFYELATNTFGASGASSPNDGQYGVEILQLWDGSIARQNQLVFTGVPLPDSCSTGGMLGLACAGLVFFARRLSFPR
jgi:hypothetical protein